MLYYSGEATFPGEASHMHFVNNCRVPWAPMPIPVLPLEGRSIDYPARAMNILGVCARGRVWHI